MEAHQPKAYSQNLECCLVYISKINNVRDIGSPGLHMTAFKHLSRLLSLPPPPTTIRHQYVYSTKVHSIQNPT